jgi:hypothetical protein
MQLLRPECLNSVTIIYEFICIIFVKCAGRMCKLRQIESQARFTCTRVSGILAHEIFGIYLSNIESELNVITNTYGIEYVVV